MQFQQEAVWNLYGDFARVCPAFGTVSSTIKTIGFSMCRQQKWLHLALFSHGYIAIVCSSEAFCHVGKVCSFMDTHMHVNSHIHIRASGWFTLLEPTDLQPHDLSEPASHSVQVVARFLQLLQHHNVYSCLLSMEGWGGRGCWKQSTVFLKKKILVIRMIGFNTLKY